MDLGRRAFLRGRPRLAGVLRPPRAVSEARFLRMCDRCGDCPAACPARAIAMRKRPEPASAP
jgi:ferredoxin-type protein NapF